MSSPVPRPEHPRPQFVRNRWLNLNGTWKFAFDFGLSGMDRGWPSDPSGLDLEITVPFCPESRLSEIGHTDFIPAVWYHRTFAAPDDWAGARVLLRFGAVDYDCTAWVNGQAVGRHLGGGASFAFDVTEALTDGEDQLVVYARDDLRSGIQPGGKQCPDLHSRACHYTRTTGIWQTVWLEAVPESRIDSVRIVPDLDGGRLIVTPTFRGISRDHAFRVTVMEAGNEKVARQVPAVDGGSAAVSLPDHRPWSPDDPYLYSIRLELVGSAGVIDQVDTYAGLRKFHIEDNRFFLNNEPIFLRQVLDQGFYPDGIWTAPTDGDLKTDIERAMAVGFNGARLHQKVFEERFHYWADRLGYLTWGEFYDWGLDFGQPQALLNQQREWREIVRRDLNHPSIVAWTPFNETIGAARNHPEAHRQALQETYELTRALDPTRPVNDASGYVHVATDIFTVHDYEQDTDVFRERYSAVDPGHPDTTPIRFPELSVPYQGQPYVMDEYGGTWWSEATDSDTGGDRKVSWGYGNRPGDIEEVYARIEGLTRVLTDNASIAGYCYTQLTDIEQEQNGIYTYDRKLKFDADRLKAAFAAPAAIEKS